MSYAMQCDGSSLLVCQHILAEARERERSKRTLRSLSKACDVEVRKLTISGCCVVLDYEDRLSKGRRSATPKGGQPRAAKESPSAKAARFGSVKRFQKRFYVRREGGIRKKKAKGYNGDGGMRRGGGS